jgi:spermidine/putrescine transport system permease protein
VSARTAARLRFAALGLWSFVAIVYLFVPIAIVALFSFNDPRGRFNITWEGFTLDHWREPFGVEGLGQAFWNSLQIAAISTALAVIMGTFMALALVRHRFRGGRALDFLVFLPLATPEVVLGAALLALFLTVNVATGFVTIVLAHTMFAIAYVVITVRARLQGMGGDLEEAAMDLGANEWTAFRLVTLPLILPGVAAAGLLAFVLSIDDFVITNFNAGTTITFPLYIWGAARQGVPPQVNVLATGLLVAAIVLMAVNLAIQARRVEPEREALPGAAPRPA